MPENTPTTGENTEIEGKAAALAPSPEEISVLSATEKFGFRLTHKMNRGAWKRFWTFCQRHVGSLWIQISTYNLMRVFGLENFEKTDARRPVLLVSNHRSFFDMYVVSTTLFRRTNRRFRLFFPVRAKFFYDSPAGWLVNLVMGWFSMYPPFFREAGEMKKREFDKFSLRRLVQICSEAAPNIIGFHPEGKRNLNANPYEFLPAQPGIGKVIFSARPQVVPVFIAGLGNDLPKQVLGNWRGGEPVRVHFGEPIDFSEFYEKRDSVRTHKEIADFLMLKIGELGEKDKIFMKEQG
ncbi:MAG TPA: lysophospholipid acyltransferase family protein [Pyrinomonadaceae bacterium]